MGKKKLLENKQEVPERKKQRTGLFRPAYGVKDCDIYLENYGNKVAVTFGTFTANIERLSIQQIKNNIELEDAIKFEESDRVHLYPAFKEALKRLLTTVDEILTDETNPCRLILIHGVPKVGKSTLARSLSYYLALSAGREKTVQFRQLNHSSEVDYRVLTDSIISTAKARGNHYLVVDQVNTNSLNPRRIEQCARERLTVGGVRMPLIMFTSGRCSPGEDWLQMQRCGLLCYKVISMGVDPHFVSKLTRDEGLDDIVYSDVMLNVTTCYEHLTICLHYLLSTKNRGNEMEHVVKDNLEDVLRDVIYPMADIEHLKRNSSIHFLWLAWKSILSAGIPPLDQFTDEHCKLDTHYVHYLDYLLSDGPKDSRDRGINGVLNIMELTGPTQYERCGYIEFKYDSYSYKFVHKKPLHQLLIDVAVRSYTVDDKLQLLLSVFHQLTMEKATLYNYVKDGLFELMIDEMCIQETAKRNGGPVGMYCVGSNLEFGRVDICETVSHVHELCNLPQKYQGRDKKLTIWCALNFPEKPPFKGFDYAFFELCDKSVLKKMQLFQVAANPMSKKLEAKLKMATALDDIKTELVNRRLIKQCDVDHVVVAYFIHPYPENSQMQFPFRAQNSITVDVLGFPRDLKPK